MLIFGSFMLGVSCACRSWRAFWLTMLFGVFGIALWAQSAHGQSPTPEMQRAYQRLHALGHAHSVEVWQGDELVGGLYGVTVGAVFCGESMFSHQSDASKVALVTLAGELQSRGYLAIDCQMYTHHLATLGAEEIPRARFMALLQHPAPAMPWPGTPA